MRIKALKKFFISGQKGYEKGKEYDVTDEVGQTLLKRELAAKASTSQPKKEEPKTEEKPEEREPKPKKSTK